MNVNKEQTLEALKPGLSAQLPEHKSKEEEIRNIQEKGGAQSLKMDKKNINKRSDDSSDTWVFNKGKLLNIISFCM